VVEQADKPLRVELLSTGAELAALAPAWDDLVGAMPRPSPFLLNAWLVEWWRHYGADGRLAVRAAFAVTGSSPGCRCSSGADSDCGCSSSSAGQRRLSLT
jgi:hypothetical protein